MNAHVTETFAGGTLDARWQPWTIGAGRLDLNDGRLRCVLNPCDARAYSDAQISDYRGLPARAFPWRAPLRLTVRAWASHPTADLRGTAGFGFWNEPFVPVGGQRPRLPRAAWFFFGSPPNAMTFAAGVPGHGWKAAVLDASRPAFWLLAPFALPGFLVMRVPALYRRLWPLAQRAIGAAETLLPVDLIDPHTYTLEWRAESVRFAVDGVDLLTTPAAPRGPLGFIAWMDNQYAIVTPQGRFGFGLLATTAQQWLALERIDIQAL